MSPEILHRVGMMQGTYPGLWKYLIGRRQGILTSEHWWNNLLQIIFKNASIGGEKLSSQAFRKREKLLL